MIADSITSGLAGKMDPGTEAYAAAYELMNDAQILQNAGSQIRQYWIHEPFISLGKAGGIQVATADPSENLESIVNLSPLDGGEWHYVHNNGWPMAANHREQTWCKREPSCSCG